MLLILALFPFWGNNFQFAAKSRCPPVLTVVSNPNFVILIVPRNDRFEKAPQQFPINRLGIDSDRHLFHEVKHFNYRRAFRKIFI